MIITENTDKTLKKVTRAPAHQLKTIFYFTGVPVPDALVHYGEIMSFFSVSPEKEKKLTERMEKLGIRENDLIEKFIRSGGKGGQNVNKTATCVYLEHIPTGISVKMQKERSQSLNRFLARRLLFEKIENRLSKEKTESQKKIEKLKRQKRKRSKRAKEKMLRDKKLLSEKKEMRKPIRP